MRANYQQEITSLNQQVLTLYQLGQYEEAIELATRTSDLARETLGSQHIDFATSLHNLAELHRASGHYAQSEPLCLEAIEIKRRVLGEVHPDYANSLNNLAVVYQSMGHYLQAEKLYRQAIDIRRETLGRDHPQYAASLNNLADLYRQLGNLEESVALHREAYQILVDALGENHPQVAISLNNLALLQESMGNYLDAKELYEQVVEIDGNVLGHDHPDYATDLNNLAELYHAMGNYEEAGRLYLESLAIRELVLGPDHPDYAASMNNLAALYAGTRREVQAMSLMEDANDIDCQTIRQVFALKTQEQRLAFMQTFQGKLDIYLSLVNQYFSNSPAAARTALLTVQQRKLVTSESIASERDLELVPRYFHLKRELCQLADLRDQIAQAAQDQGSSEEKVRDFLFLEELLMQREALEQHLMDQVPDIYEEVSDRISDRETIQALLPEGNELVEFVRYRSFDFAAIPALGESRWAGARYLAFVKEDESSPVRLFDLGKAAPLDERLQQARFERLANGKLTAAD